MKEQKWSKVNGDDKSWFGKLCNEEQHANQQVEQNFEIFSAENNVRKRRLQKQIEILKVKKGKCNLLNNVTYFRSEKLFDLVICGKC